ncbi:MAG: suppressor of fused domain protein, partial [Myxococcota bacterium]
MSVDAPAYAARVWDHYAQFFDDPVAQTKLRGPADEPLHVLEYGNVFEGCRTFTTIGLGLLEGFVEAPHELFLAATWPGEELPHLLVATALALREHGRPLRAGMAASGLQPYAPAFAETTGKSAMMFVPPQALPPLFSSVGGKPAVEVLMAVPLSELEYALLARDGIDAL